MGISFKTEVEVAPSKFEIHHQTNLLMIGSCFSDHIGGILARLKFPVLQNPFGVLYNPASIAQALEIAINKTEIKKNQLIQQSNLWHSFAFHGSFSNISPDIVIENTNKCIKETHEYLKNAKVLFVTFGTAWVYQFKKTNTIVSNCHKIPSDHFNRFRLSVSEICDEWNNLIKTLKKINPDLKIIFTVSPVRHLKDGAHCNQLSKSTLFLAIEELIRNNKTDNLAYFPSFEIVNDELRDYRFYSDDMLHITDKAVQYIFEKFERSFFSKSTIKCSEEINSIQQAYHHRILSKDRDGIDKFVKTTLQKIEVIEKKYPYIKFSLEKKYFENL